MHGVGALVPAKRREIRLSTVSKKDIGVNKEDNNIELRLQRKGRVFFK